MFQEKRQQQKKVKVKLKKSYIIYGKNLKPKQMQKVGKK